MGSSQNAADFWHASDSDGSEQFDNVPLANEKYFSASNEAPYVREGALKWIRADRAQAERFRVEGRIAEAEAIERAADEAEKDWRSNTTRAARSSA